MSDRLPEQVIVDRRKTHVGIPAERPTGRFRIAEHDRQFGAKGQYKHRSGWPYVVSILRDAQDRDGILIDDFVERTFATGTQASAVMSAAKSIAKRLLPSMVPGTIWKEPWVGIFHTPHRCPEWFDENAHPGMVITKWTFQESLPHLRGAIALSEYLAGWLRTQLSVPVVALKHPTDFTTAKFSWEAFAGNPEKKLVQVGWYLRNYRAIYQVRAPEWIMKIHLAQEGATINRARARTDAHPVYGTRP